MFWKMFKAKPFVLTIQNYWNRRSFYNTVNQAEAVEFLVRVTYYIYRVWEVIMANEKYWKSVWLIGIFASDYSFEFADQLIAELQVVYYRNVNC